MNKQKPSAQLMIGSKEWIVAKEAEAAFQAAKQKADDLRSATAEKNKISNDPEILPGKAGKGAVKI